MDQTTGFLGLGSMGLPIARNLARAGHRLRVYNRTAAKAEPLREFENVTIAHTPLEVAEPGGVVLSMLADDNAVTQASEGLAEALGPDGLHISLSTIAPTTATALAAQGCGFLSAPVFGRPDRAESAELIVLSAGEQRHRERARPLLEAIGAAVHELGEDPASANGVKLAGNFLIMSALEAMSEAFAFAEKHGVPRELAAQVLTTTPVLGNAYRGYGAAISSGAYEPAGFALRLGHKDARLVAQAADRLGVPMPIIDLVANRFTAAENKGRGDLDWSALAIEVFESAGLDQADPR
ncbi:NAD(P)-dependent oxidoreductase [Kutzneria viridogrisea]|uniref:3-hydroxyisobutyrate dehydrogenase-like beta-hydroxyacid dehydrogenase n=1 Tax=Kutzneria viridogrisea TaxID=47990 RepID=A0ABR6BLJ5_9PSEU|nr:3-hydroxyisobutyrate dehydrogenase-like beta-hydroxyacid dehydrogenase [Kutzneria viridogrisea]